MSNVKKNILLFYVKTCWRIFKILRKSHNSFHLQIHLKLIFHLEFIIHIESTLMGLLIKNSEGHKALGLHNKNREI